MCVLKPVTTYSEIITEIITETWYNSKTSQYTSKVTHNLTKSWPLGNFAIPEVAAYDYIIKRKYVSSSSSSSPSIGENVFTCYLITNLIEAIQYFRFITGDYFLLIYIWNFHFLSHLLLIYICKLLFFKCSFYPYTIFSWLAMEFSNSEWVSRTAI